MQKLVTKNPVLRFKLEKKIVKAQFGTLIDLATKLGLGYLGATLSNSKSLPKQTGGVRGSNNILNRTRHYVKEKSELIVNNAKTKTSKRNSTSPRTTITSTPVTSQATETINLLPIEPVSVITPNVENTRQGYSFTLPKPEATQTTELPMLTPPEARDYNRDNVRAMRGTYSNVDLYFDYLRNNPDSNEARLWDNMWYGVSDWNKRRQIFDETMNLHRISGNLGRRDSGRLANLHNLLRRITVPGSESEIGFRNGLSTYNTVPELPNYSDYINWRDALNLTHTNTPFVTYAKQGSKLISRNPVERFKIRKGLLGLKNKKILNGKNDLGENVLTTIINKRTSNPFKTNETISQEVTYTPEGNDTVYYYIPSQYPWNFLYETSNNWHTAGVSLRRPLFEKLRDKFNYLDGRPKFRNFIKVAQ